MCRLFVLGLVSLCVFLGSALGQNNLRDQPLVVMECPILPIDDLRVAAQVQGIIGELAVKEGDTVRADQIIAKVKDDLARVQYEGQQVSVKNESPIEEARARLEETQAERDSTKLLVERRAETPEKLRTEEAKVLIATAQLKNAEVERELAKNKLNYYAEEVLRHEIRSPIDGRVEEVLIKRGEAVEPLAPIIHIINMNKVRVKGAIELSQAQRVEAGMVVEVYPDIAESPKVTLMGHTAPVTAVIMLPGNERAISAAEDGVIIEWDLRRRGQKRVLDEHEDKVTSLAISPNAPDRLVSGDAAGNVWTWDLAQGKTIQKIATKGGGVTSLRIHPVDPNLAVAGHDDRSIRVWDLKTGQQRAEFLGHRSYIYSVDVTPDGKRMVSTGDDQTIRIWDMAKQTSLHLDRGRSGDVRKCGLSSDGQYYLFNSLNTLQVRSTTTYEIAAAFTNPKGSFVHLAEFVPTRNLILTGASNDEIELWQFPEQGREPRLARRYRGHVDALNAVDFASDGSLFISGGADRVVRLWTIPPEDRLKAERLTGRITFVGDIVEASQRSVFAEIENVGGVLTGYPVATMVVYPGEPVETPQQAAHVVPQPSAQAAGAEPGNSSNPLPAIDP